ncbi:MAG: hypothetical protein M1820_007409 [Bogoriella megaspora]|nr:MAG: hypothetical protein M1820_007409 [Bogoriella megaspora]
MFSTACLAAVALLVPNVYTQALPPVDPTALQDTITIDALIGGEQALEDFAYATPERNRLVGSTAHNDTINYLFEQLSSLGDYYNVTLQPWSTLTQTSGSANFSANGADQNATVFEYSQSGAPTAPLVAVANFGCDLTDYPAEVTGNIALISRGTCEFGAKSVNAGLAGADGAVIYNNVAGSLSGTLGPPRPAGPYVPTAGISLEQGTALLDQINAGTEVIGDLSVETVIEERYTNNVIAQTVGGDQNNVLALGGHTDSVAAGPGINDDGSGTIGVLEVAKQLSNYSVTNAVRFGFWAGEEEGLLGSTFYVDNLPAEELAKIRLYLNYDMIASPNFVYAIYDGDGSSFNLTGPQGSAEAEELFEDYFADNGLNFTATEFSGRSDYGPFLEAGIASGGLFTGAEGIKTEEEAEAFGGEANVAYDVNYHGPGDNVTNLNATAFLANTKAIAYSTAVYATSFDSLGQTKSKRSMAIRGSTNARKPKAGLTKLRRSKIMKRKVTPETPVNGETTKKMFKAMRTRKLFI